MIKNRGINMRTRMTIAFLWVAAAFALPQVARAQSLVIDDFTTGNHEVTLRSGDETHVQSGSMIGGFRQTYFRVPGGAVNPFNQPGTLDIRPGGPMVVNTGTRVFHRLEVYYGVDGDGAIAPLNRNLSGYDRFRVEFDSCDVGLNFNIVVFSAEGSTYSQLGYNLFANTNPFSVDFPFADFTGGANFSDVDLIALVFQSASAIGANDFAVTSLSAATGSDIARLQSAADAPWLESNRTHAVSSADYCYWNKLKTMRKINMLTTSIYPTLKASEESYD